MQLHELKTKAPQTQESEVMMQQQEAGGFNFENSRRGALRTKSRTLREVVVSNQTWFVFQDGVILGADTRTTDDTLVADKNCEKIHFISPTIYGCGAGVAADALLCSQLIAAGAQLHSLNTGRRPPVAMVTRQLKQTLFRYQGQVGCSLIVGGVDDSGPQLYSVYPHGSSDRLPYVTMGSGAAAAAAVLEDRFKPNIEMQSHSSTSSPPLLALALLLLPHSSSSPLPTHEPPALGLTLLQLLDPDPEEQEAPPSMEPFFSWNLSNQDSNRDSVQESDSDQDTDLNEDQDLFRSQRGEVGHDEENRLSEALSVFAGGLQSVSREKGGFGFRFGRRGLSRV